MIVEVAQEDRAMAGEQMTEREAVLAARVKELEEAAAQSAITVAQGGVFESVWQTINSIVSPWLAAVALAVFLAHYGFAYYLQSQMTAAETQLKQAKADVEDAKAKAANQPVDGVPMRLAQMKAQLDNSRAEAAAAKANAKALNAQVNGETMALQTAKAQLDNVQNQARSATAEADAKSASFGLSTLEDRAVRARIILQQLKTVEQNEKASQNAALTEAHSGIEVIGRAMVRGECLNNQFAELIGCPSQFVTYNRQQQRAQAATTTTALQSPEQPQAPAQTLKTPLKFNCARAASGVDFTICASPVLMDAEARLEEAYRAAVAASGDGVKTAQRNWMRRDGADCGLPPRGQPSQAQMRSAYDCLLNAMNQRTGELSNVANN
jgi:hypothetical protein